MALETGRLQFSPADDAKPIRFVYVAWALVKIDGKFLLYKREDEDRTDSHGQFGPPGGKFRVGDVAPDKRDSPALLRDAAFGLTHWPIEHLMATLVRELKEELGITPDDFTVTSQREIPPYKRVYGQGNHCALTEYHFRLYQIDLTRRGLLKLLSCMASNPKDYAFFNNKEMLKSRNSDGDAADIDALKPHFDKESSYASIKDSFCDEYTYCVKEVGIDIPIRFDKSITYGRTRTDRSLKEVDAGLSPPEHEWLLALAWNAKGLNFTETSVNSRDVLLPYGWIKASPETYEIAVKLKCKLDRIGLNIIEIIDNEYVRLSIEPRLIYFSNELYSYRIYTREVRECDVRHYLAVKYVVTPVKTGIGFLEKGERVYELSQTTANLIEFAENNRVIECNKLYDDLARQDFEADLKTIGVRKFVRDTYSFIGDRDHNGVKTEAKYEIVISKC